MEDGAVVGKSISAAGFDLGEHKNAAVSGRRKLRRLQTCNSRMRSRKRSRHTARRLKGPLEIPRKLQSGPVLDTTRAVCSDGGDSAESCECAETVGSRRGGLGAILRKNQRSFSIRPYERGANSRHVRAGLAGAGLFIDVRVSAGGGAASGGNERLGNSTRARELMPYHEVATSGGGTWQPRKRIATRGCRKGWRITWRFAMPIAANPGSTGWRSGWTITGRNCYRKRRARARF